MNNISCSNVPRMLSIKEVARIGVLPETALRSLVKQGKIPSIYVGTKFLINFDKLCEWLNNPELSGVTTRKDE